MLIKREAQWRAMELIVVSTLVLVLTQTVSSADLNEAKPISDLFIDQLLLSAQLQRANSAPDPSSTNRSIINQPAASSSKPQVLSRGLLARQKPISAGQRLIGQPAKPAQPVASLASVRQRWSQMERSIGRSLSLWSAQLGATLDELAPLVNISTGCRLALGELVEGLAEQQLWAGQMVDASARLPAGLLEGTLTELGNFDQCLAISHRSEKSSIGDVSGQYCTLQVKPQLIARPRLHTVCQRLPALTNSSTNQSTVWRAISQQSHQFYYVGLRLGVCAPSKCSRSSLQQLLAAYLAKFDLLGQVKSCQTLRADSDDSSKWSVAQSQQLDSVQLCIVFTLVALLLLLTIGTSLDLLAADSIQVAAQATTTTIRNLANGAGKRVQAKSWQCQIYGDTCDHFHLSPQQNPLAEQRAELRADELLFGNMKPLDERLNPADTWTSQLEPEKSSGFARAMGSILICFSVRKNLQTIGKHVKSDAGDIRVIHGLRTLAMIWIVFGHSIGLTNPEMMNNLFSLAQLSCTSRLLQALLNATLAVNTFFMISGLVTLTSFARKCPSAMKLLSGSRKPERAQGSNNNKQPEKARKSRSRESSETSNLEADSISSSAASSHLCLGANKRRPKPPEASGWPADFQPLLWLAMRYLRLTPTYALVVGLTMLMPALGSGPFWQETVGSMGSNCKQNWWLNFVYLNNFINTDKICLIHSWYLSNDWQFFLFTLLVFCLFYKSKKVTLLLIIVSALAASAATFAITVANEFPPTIVTTSPAIAERWLFIHSLYYKPYSHLCSYLIGLITGYFILIRHRLNMSRVYRLLAWLLFSLVAISLLNSIYPWNMGLEVEPLISGLHSATFRTLWATCCAWLVFALVTKPESALARLLSWSGFQFTSRLTYCVYLLHPLIIYYHFGSLRERMDSSVYGQAHRFIATLGLSYLFALFLSLLIESPSIQLQRLLVELIGKPANWKSRQRSASSTSSSWSPTSSFSGQTGADDEEPVKEAKVAASFTLQPAAAAGSAGIEQSSGPSTPTSARSSVAPDHWQSRQGGVAAGAESPGALDAEFQRKLAQAISRGFRIRSRMANGTGRRPNGKPTLETPNKPDEQRREVRAAESGAGRKEKKGELSTFVAPKHQQQQSQVADLNYNNNNNINEAASSEHKISTINQQPNFTEMIAIKQRLLFRS